MVQNPPVNKSFKKLSWLLKAITEFVDASILCRRKMDFHATEIGIKLQNWANFSAIYIVQISFSTLRFKNVLQILSDYISTNTVQMFMNVG